MSNCLPTAELDSRPSQSYANSNGDPKLGRQMSSRLLSTVFGGWLRCSPDIRFNDLLFEAGTPPKIYTVVTLPKHF